MIIKQFQGKTLPLLGFGTMRLPLNADGTIDETQVGIMTQYAMKHGVNYFDTAYPYHDGDSERVMGRVLSAYPRDSFYLATKYPGHQLLSTGYNPADILKNSWKNVEWTILIFICSIMSTKNPWKLTSTRNGVS